VESGYAGVVLSVTSRLPCLSLGVLFELFLSLVLLLFVPLFKFTWQEQTINYMDIYNGADGCIETIVLLVVPYQIRRTRCGDGRAEDGVVPRDVGVVLTRADVGVLGVC